MKKLIPFLFMLACGPATRTINGQPYTEHLSFESARSEVMSQEAEGVSSEALDLARKSRTMTFLDGKVYLSPPVDVYEIARLGIRDERLSGQFTVGGKKSDVQTIDIHGGDSRDWPDQTGLWPVGSTATLAYETINTDPNVVQQPIQGSEGRPTCGATQVHGTNGQSVAVTSAHCVFPRHRGVFEVQQFHLGWALPHNRVGVAGTFSCDPAINIPTGWSVYGDSKYDVAVFNWSAAGCPSSDINKHAASMKMEPIPYSCIGTACSSSPTTWWWVQNWGPAHVVTGNCGPRPAAQINSYPLWPTMCGMQEWASSWSASPYVYSSYLDTVAGHSGSGIWTLWGGTSSTPQLLRGVLSGSLYSCGILGCTTTEQFVGRTAWTGSFLSAAGVQ